MNISLRKRGFTLAELMVYMVVLLVFISGVYAVFSLSLRCFHTAQARSDATQSSQQAINYINRVVATGAKVTMDTSTASTLLFLSAQPPTSSVVFQSDSATGNLKYYKWVCIWLGPGRALRQSETPSTPSPFIGIPTSTVPAPPDIDATMKNLPSRVIARNITGFVPSATGYSLTVSATAAVATSFDAEKETGVNVTNTWVTRN